MIHWIRFLWAGESAGDLLFFCHLLLCPIVVIFQGCEEYWGQVNGCLVYSCSARSTYLVIEMLKCFVI